jgi:hypothetical protein
MTTMPTGMAGVSRIAKLDSFRAALVRGGPENLPTPRFQFCRPFRFGGGVGIAPWRD